MKMKDVATSLEQLKLKDGEPAKTMKEPQLFRKGQIGDWKNYFTEEMSKKIDEMMATKLEYKKPFRCEPTLQK